jgi:transcriptional regulator with GAF, ATPase, and Fis domain
MRYNHASRGERDLSISYFPIEGRGGVNRVASVQQDITERKEAERSLNQEVTDDNLTEMEREHIVRVLRETNGVRSGTDGAASRLGIKRTTLQSMLKRFGIELQDFRGVNGTFGPR